MTKASSIGNKGVAAAIGAKVAPRTGAGDGASEPTERDPLEGLRSRVAALHIGPRRPAGGAAPGARTGGEAGPSFASQPMERDALGLIQRVAPLGVASRRPGEGAMPGYLASGEAGASFESQIRPWAAFNGGPATSATSASTWRAPGADEPGGPRGNTSHLRLDEEARRLYRQLNLKVTRETLPAFRDADRLAVPEKLGAGRYNTAFSVALKNPDGTMYQGVFKPLNPTEKATFAKESGIPANDPQTAMRNLSTQAYAQALGFDVVPTTRVAVLTVPRPPWPDAPAVPTLSVGLLMDRAPGIHACQLSEEFLSHSAVLRAATEVQVLDNLLLQGDRHGANLFFHFERAGPGAWKVKATAIDNDLCLGKGGLHPEFNLKEFGGRNWSISMPAVVDREMADAVSGLTEANVIAILAGRQSPEEVAAALSRLHVMKDHILGLEAEGAVIPPDDDAWNSDFVRQRLNEHNSYAIRDIHEKTHPTRW